MKLLLSISFLLFLFDVRQAIMIVVPTVSVLASDSAFVENERTTFICQLPVSYVYLSLTGIWYLRDPVTKVRLFYTKNIYTSTFETPFDSDGSIKLSLMMRRDFSGAELVCRTSNDVEGHLRLKTISARIPVQSVKFLPSPTGIGDKFKIRCEVTAEPHVIKTVYLRSKGGMLKGKNSVKINGSTTYEWVGPRSMLSRFDAEWMQCLTFTEEGFTESGIVTSRMAQVVVPYIERSASKVTLSMDQRLDLTFWIKTEAALSSDMLGLEFRSVDKGDSNVEILRVPISLTHKKTLIKNVLEARVENMKASNGHYMLRCKSDIFITKSEPVHANVLIFKFEKFNSASRLNVTRDEITTLDLIIRANFHLDAVGFHVRRGASAVHHPEQVDVTPHGDVRDQRFRVKLKMKATHSGPHRVSFTSCNVNASSEVFHVAMNYFKITQFPPLVSYRSNAQLTFEVMAEPKPGNLSVLCGESEIASVAKVTKMEESAYKYRIQITFVPPRPMRCKVGVNSNSRYSPEFITAKLRNVITDGLALVEIDVNDGALPLASNSTASPQIWLILFLTLGNLLLSSELAIKTNDMLQYCFNIFLFITFFSFTIGITLSEKGNWSLHYSKKV